MAIFNQSPTGQTSLTIALSGLALGSAAETAIINFMTNNFVIDASFDGETVYADFSYVKPRWRRESKIISAKQ